jgi:hypothetical protein
VAAAATAQASFSIFVLYISYVLHANFNPFLPRRKVSLLELDVNGSKLLLATKRTLTASANFVRTLLSVARVERCASCD